MDNKINEIRRKISALRAEMTLVEAAIRDQVNRDLDCSEASYRLLAMRAVVAELIGRWKAAGGGDRLPTVRERLTRSHAERPLTKPDKGKSGSGRVTIRP
ncbi:hypothetical protein UP10_15685 [Bradyrhizobium sp. LTSPM299]|jgi:chorismate mutase|uniref:hypothetical protein n=1 Tax=Bradyrhizobium sp. LTSPM299 TaxID=1619233 RepID=UPI0005C8090A|nr:hypothetical protein [Bradyrhizobium sp. LTSPM299]KJC60097.1 hypothetical protein UP10_15685 [Bradyrhizobium sp. LTSPM299]